MKLQKVSNKGDQYSVYLPKKIVEAMKWKPQDEIDVEIMGKDKLKLERKKPGTVK